MKSYCYIHSLGFTRYFRIFAHQRVSYNVSKILDDIQKRQRKQQNGLRPSTKTSISTKTKPIKLKENLRYNIKNNSSTRKLNVKDNNLVAADLSIDCSTTIASTDIFQELGLDSYMCENLEEVMQNNTIVRNNAESYDIFDDINLTKRNLLSYIHVSIYNDNLSEAHQFLLEFIGKFSNSLSTNDIGNCCELLIKGWARKGNTDNVIELMDFIRNSLKLNLNTQIYEYYLLSLEKQIKETTKDNLEQVFSEMRSSNIKPEYLFFRSTLNRKEIQLIRDMFQRFDVDLKLKKYNFPKMSRNKHLQDIMAIPQKHYDPFEGIDLSQMNQLVEEQFCTEIDSTIKVKPIDAQFNDLDAKEPESFYKRLIELLESCWKQSLAEGFQNYLRTIRSKHKRLNGIPFVHYMTLMEPEIYVEAMIEEIRKCSSFSESYSPFALHLFETLGRKIMSKYLLRSNQNDDTFADFKNCYEKYVQYTMNPELIRKFNPREYWQHLIENGNHYFFDESKYWANNVLKEIGKDLYEVISNSTMFNSEILLMSQMSLNNKNQLIQPVISFLYKSHEMYKTKKEVRVHPLLIKLYEGARSDIHFESERLPMICPPVPWISSTFGGNLLHRSFIVRPPPYYPRKKLKNLPVNQMYPTFDSLNALSLCPWKINQKILDLAIDVFKNKGDLELDIPISLSGFGALPRASSDMTPKEKSFIYHKRKTQKKEQAEMYSLWVDCMYKLSIGNKFRDQIFWFPINTDFRSRVYPIPPNFNHLGSDLSRALLLFAKGKPLGEQGLKWLKIHLINLTGLKKRYSTEDRLAYCDEVLDLIFDSADKPFDGQRWWMQSDEKWQTLACCIELTNAIRSGDPANYVSHIPIHQDGSCNGLQHYAALGRDLLGAKSVNLFPDELPQDVYSDVAKLVELEIEKDCANNLEIANVVKGFISRKIVKQTVMTYVYGVTKYGAKLQVLKRLKEDSKFPENHKTTASLYISEKILLSIQKMFTQTRSIQNWLTNCAQIISNDYGATVEWVTPLGFPVVQSYYKAPKKTSPHLLPNTMKQKNAFPANFIHSLDSSHMMLTSLECHRNGLTFASVHDCYWTHASNIDLMNLYCRKQFVALHSQPILDNLAKQLRMQLESINKEREIENHRKFVQQVDQQISKGEFDLNSVMNSIYFFS
ncbi:hypothetical protein RDWZM_005785 [Blomia tropicalis]|uniref:DNA-directed RNA polymerase n=1 Tax=Blomia tropicalis TaxID=40697 RepID=A0A9Q0M7E8_BLOTA|nr:hypothetical protein RDWZM_005785 [Blomia tropicalis]